MHPLLRHVVGVKHHTFFNHSFRWCVLHVSAGVSQGSDLVTHWISDRAGPKTGLDSGADKVLCLLLEIVPH